MDAAYVSALAALAGSAIGALASLATTWLTQHAQARTTLRLQDRARREALYGEFIREASKLFVDAFEHELDDPSKLLQLYAIVSTIRLFGQPRTVAAAAAHDYGLLVDSSVGARAKSCRTQASVLGFPNKCSGTI